MREKWRELLQNFSQDRRSGSSELAGKAEEILREYFAENEVETALAGWPELARKIIEGQPSMAAVINLVNHIGLELEKQEGLRDLMSIARVISQTISGIDISHQKAIEFAAEKLSQFKRICAYSRSFLVEAAVLEAHSQGADFSVVLSEARPAREGLTLAKKLAAAGIKVELCVDAALPGKLAECDCLLLGADAVKEKLFLNKIGSELLCREAQRREIPVLVVATKEKLLPPELEKYLHITDLSREKIFDELTPGIFPVNRLFEWCPNELVTLFLGDFGEVRGMDIRKHIISDTISALFADYTGSD